MNHFAVSFTDSARQPAARGGVGGLTSPPRRTPGTRARLTPAQQCCLRLLAVAPATLEQIARGRWRELYTQRTRHKLSHTRRVLDRLVSQGLASRHGVLWNVEYALTPAGREAVAGLRRKRGRHAR